ncbi:MAG TPA: DUF554 domain-containing protein [Saprospiraceae bacterium]|nr:DUF554 domain-containing protein [Saprospiraceae bacterium]
MNRLPIGTFINMLTVIVGSLIGVSLQQAFPANIQQIIFQAIGLASVLIGIQMSLRVPDGYLLVLVFSMILGGVIGELIHLDLWLQAMGDNLKDWVATDDSRFTEGLVTAFILFCVGSMTIVGALDEGLQGKRELLLIKSTLDGVTSIAFAATYGIGVLFSIIPMFFLQGGITILAKWMERFFTKVIINQISAAGGLLIIAIAVRLLGLGEVNIENLLPSLLVVALLSWPYEQFLLRYPR